MRFAYIDSQGKEVGIPTVEALQLRIELGAITEETIFYDASKDRWDPAGEHEIFRTLSREIRERGQEGPRPPTPRVERTTRTPRSPAEPDDPRRTVDPLDSEPDPLGDTAEPGEVGWVEAELEDLAESDVGSSERRGPPADAGGEWDVDLGDFGSLDLAPDLADAGAPDRTRDEPAAGDEPGSPGEDAGAGEVPEDSEAPDVVDLPAGAADPPDFPAATDDLKLERPFGEEHEGGGSVLADEELELETPLAEAEPPRAGPWDDREMAGADEDHDPPAPPEPAPSSAAGEDRGPAGGTGAAPSGGAEERSRLGRPDPYDRRVQPPPGEGPRRRPRRPPRRRSGPSPRVLAGAAAVVVAAGVGGWWVWSASGAGSDPTEAEAVPAVPELPPELESLVGPVAASAYGDMLDSLRAMAAGFDLPAEPNPDWLAGVYLANADAYPDVAAYWEAFRRYLDRVRSVDEDMFMDAFGARLDASGIPAGDRDTVTVRVRAGFQASAGDRAAVYDQLASLIQAATELHQFLVANGSNIAYEPAAGLSRDPVTEAIPSTQALGDEMWERVGRIPTALDALGTLDRVTTERILDVFFRRLESTGIR